MSTAQHVDDRSVKLLSTSERLRLAALILNDLPPQAVVDDSEEWTDEDLRDFSRTAWTLIDRKLGKDPPVSPGWQ